MAILQYEWRQFSFGVQVFVLHVEVKCSCSKMQSAGVQECLTPGDIEAGKTRGDVEDYACQRLIKCVERGCPKCGGGRIQW